MKNFPILKSENLQSDEVQIFGPRLISFALKPFVMNLTIQFNDKPDFMAIKIKNERPKRMLATKFEAGCVEPPKMPP